MDRWLQRDANHHGRRSSRWLMALGVGLMVGLALGVGAAPAVGQTRFAWPDTAVDVSTYTTIDGCMAALDRVKRTILSREGRVFRRDTLPADPQEVLQPAPAPVVQTAQRCAARFAAVDSIPLKGFDYFLALYLNAGLDQKANELVTRRLSTIAPEAKHERATVIDTVVASYLGQGADGLLATSVRPVRIAAAEELLNGLARQLSDRVEQMKIYARLMNTTLNVADTVGAVRNATRIVATADSLTAAERQALLASDDTLRSERILVYNAQRLLNHHELLDSLERSTAAYVSLARGLWTRTTQLRSEAYDSGMPIGEHAPAIQGDFWFGRPDSGSVYPRSGHPSLAVFLDANACMLPKDALDFTEAAGCWNIWATVRRLAKRFPALEITVIGQTHGYFQYAVPTTPADEAQLMQEWMNAHGVHATLAVTNTSFWRLPAPDDRRIEKPSPTTTHFTFGKSWQVQGGSAFLIDSDGTIVHVSSRGLNNATESEYSELIQILLSRNLARR